MTRKYLGWQPRRRVEGGLALAAALVWLVWSRDANGAGFAVALPASLWLAGSGFSLVFFPGHLHITQHVTLASCASFALALVFGFACGPPLGVGLILLLSLLSAVGAAHAAVSQEQRYAGAPRPRGAMLPVKVAVDEAVLGWFTLLARTPVADDAHRALREVGEAESLWARNGWFHEPAAYHRQPTAPATVSVAPRPVGRWAVEELTTPSEYEPWPDEPGRRRWLERTANRTLHARMLRHGPGGGRWLICIHGYRMGNPRGDLSLFRPRWLHRQLGINLMMPVLPLHGPRRAGWLSGDGFLDGDPMDTLHAEAQAVWDIRCLLRWLREAQGATSVGVLGFSLGGYTAALLAALEPELDCVIAGIPAADLAALQWRHSSGPALRYLESIGMSEGRVRRLYGVVSPLELSCALPLERRFMFAATADRLVSPAQVVALWRHWDEPEIAWFQGGHLTFRSSREVRSLIGRALRRTVLAED